MSTVAEISTDDILAFAARVNQVRNHFNLGDVETWEVTSSEPNSTINCLSARHLLGPIEANDPAPTETVWTSVLPREFSVGINGPVSIGDLAEACGCGTETHGDYVQIPDEITAVTSVFDHLWKDENGRSFHLWEDENGRSLIRDDRFEGVLEDLRDKFIEAGLEAK